MALAVDLDLDLDLDLRRLKACRASQVEAAAEVPMLERSEFGHRAALAETRRAPMRLHRIGRRQEQWFWFLLPKQKELAQRAKALDLQAEAKGTQFRFVGMTSDR